jgi:hypothetical protein
MTHSLAQRLGVCPPENAAKSLYIVDPIKPVTIIEAIIFPASVSSGLKNARHASWQRGCESAAYATPKTTAEIIKT